MRSSKRLAEVCDFLSANPDAQSLSHTDLAERLNSEGVLNLKSSKGYRVPWTREALRPVRKAAERQMTEDTQGLQSGDHTADPQTTEPAPHLSLPTQSEPCWKTLPRAELFRLALEATRNIPRALTEHEHGALVISVREDLEGPRQMRKTDIDKLMVLIRNPGLRLSTRNLDIIHAFVRKRAVGKSRAPDAP